MNMYDYVWLCMNMQGYVPLCMDMQGYVWVCKVMHGYVALRMVMHDMQGYVAPMSAIYGYVTLRMPMYGYAWVCSAMYGCVGPCMAMKRCLKFRRDMLLACSAFKLDSGYPSKWSELFLYNLVPRLYSAFKMAAILKAEQSLGRRLISVNNGQSAKLTRRRKIYHQYYQFQDRNRSNW